MTRFDEIRVLELGEGVSAAMAARLLADHGADVVKAEEPGGDWSRRRGPFPGDRPDPEQSGLFLALNANKRGVCVDLETVAGRQELLQLVDWADILIHNLDRNRAQALGIGPDPLEWRRPDLVTLSITPFGIEGPHADYRAVELSISAGGGWAGLCPSATLRRDLPPLKVFGHQCGFMAGVAGATAALAAHRSAARCGVGEFIDFSEQEYTASVLENAVPQYAYQGRVATRYGTRLLVPWGIFECRDGPLFLVCIEEDQWQRLVEFMGRPEWASLEVFSTTLGRAQNQDVLHTFLAEWLADHSAVEIYHALQKHRICAAPVMGMEQMAENDHLRAREFFVEVDHPRAGRLPYLAGATRTASGRRGPAQAAPLLGQHDAELLRGRAPARKPPADVLPPSLPLAGIRVADLSWAWAGPFCAMNLAYLGAEVVRFESAGRPDLYRRLPIHPEGVPVTLNTSGMFNQWNQGKKSVALNLAEPRAIELLLDFVERCDVVVENFATGVMERLGLGYDVLAERNPAIVLASISGYGETGPYREYMGYGPAIPALTGLAAATGFLGGGPREVGVSMPDPNAGITAAFEVCAALVRREDSGRGEHLDISLWEATAQFAVESWMAWVMDGRASEPMGNRDPQMAPHGCFATRGEDQWISIACRGDDQWRGLAAVVDPSLAADDRFRGHAARKAHEDALEAELAVRIRDWDRWELTTALQAEGVPAFPALTAEDIALDPHMNERGFLERLQHPEVGRRVHTGIPYRLRRRPNGVRAPAPVLGADTDAVLREVHGLGAEEIRALRDAKVLY